MWLIKVLIICASVLICTSSQLTYMVPKNYHLVILLNEGFEKSKNFEGVVTINMTLEGLNTSKSFSLHAKNLIIDEDNIQLYNRTKNFRLTINHVDDVLIIDTAEDLWSGNYTLMMSYEGFLNEDSTRGFYLSAYTDNEGNTKYLAVTNFGEIDARRVFPCFDQPEFTSTFDIDITYPKKYTALASTDEQSTILSNNLKLASFKKTPEMSTHLLAFAILEFDCSNSSYEQITIQICARHGQENATIFAEEVVDRVLKTVKNYTGTSYEEFGIDKLTLIAVPNFDTYVRENSWGLLLFSESDFLLDKNESSNYWRQKVVSSLAHNLAYQWFGRIITLAWSSDKFVHQGFATFFEYQIPDEFEECQVWECCIPATCANTSWEFRNQFSINVIQTALLDDSSNNTSPLSHGTDYQNDDTSNQSDIPSNKGASIFRMIYNILGPSKFTAWLTEYTKRSKTTKASVDFLWNVYDSMNASTNLPPNTTLNTIMQNWIKKSGYPLLHVSTDGKNMIITQEPFSLNKIDEDVKWYVPITYYFGKKYKYNNTYYSSINEGWITPDKDFVVDLKIQDDWDLQYIMISYGQDSFYRVSYDNTLLSKLSSSIESTTEVLRSHIIDDMFNLARVGKKSYKDVLDFIVFLKNDTSYYSWYSTLNNFNYLLQRSTNLEIQNALKTYLKDLMTTLIRSTTLQVEAYSHIPILRQTLAQTWACKLGDSDCVSISKRRFYSYISNNTVKPNLRTIVYCNGLRYSDNASKDFNFLWTNYLESTIVTEKVTILEALGCVQDPNLRKEYLAKTLTADIKIHDSKYVFQSLSSSTSEGVTEVLNFLYENYSKIEKHFGNDSDILSNSVAKLVELINTQDQIDLLVNLTLLENIGDTFNKTLTTAIDKATTNLEASMEIEESLKEYFNVTGDDHDDNDDDDDNNNDSNDANKTVYQVLNIALLMVGYQILINF